MPPAREPKSKDLEAAISRLCEEAARSSVLLGAKRLNALGSLALCWEQWLHDVCNDQPSPQRHTQLKQAVAALLGRLNRRFPLWVQTALNLLLQQTPGSHQALDSAVAATRILQACCSLCDAAMDHPGLLPSPADAFGSFKEALLILLPEVAATWRSADRATTALQLDNQLAGNLSTTVSKVYSMSLKVGLYYRGHGVWCMDCAVACNDWLYAWCMFGICPRVHQSYHQTMVKIMGLIARSSSRSINRGH